MVPSDKQMMKNNNPHPDRGLLVSQTRSKVLDIWRNSSKQKIATFPHTLVILYV